MNAEQAKAAPSPATAAKPKETPKPVPQAVASNVVQKTNTLQKETGNTNLGAPAQDTPPPPSRKGGSVVPLPIRGKPDAQKAVKESIRFFSMAGLRPQQKRRRLLWLSFLVCVVIPAFMGSVYFLFIASDRYVAKAGFAIRSLDGPSVGGDILGAFTGLASTGSTTTDSYMVMDYLHSREIVERLSRDMGIREKYSADNVDFFYRLDATLPVEDLVNYWEWMISASFDTHSSIINFEVEAFTPQDAERAGRLILGYISELVNDISEQARQDTVRFAEEEVSRAELRLRMIRNRMSEFRETENAIDPSLNAEVQVQLIARLQEQLTDTRARLATLEGTIDESSPTLRQLRRQEKAILGQLQQRQNEIGGGGQFEDSSLPNTDRLSPLSSMIASYEELELENQFAQKAYVAALASLEQSRAEADRLQRYLAVFERPATPEQAIYPRRITNTLLLIVGLIIVWSIGTLMVYSVRDHLR
ncbi:lipopolysaccharide biosynthesis protein [Pseudovibrio sp. SPO723]|uniref:lipopolysaccharide biosynthesis protein n=1 Tax=Nesiotobacter zosterae TaxID=392721 RepID=UPI0029C51FFC|nr:lipopolysaccharide biosynthesis protein [Pseudovibrio sp. SPO723]MDX5594359.1 lipopolysaccharide biosynthesis protein [Pseudovibrio sp. SPO723]